MDKGRFRVGLSMIGSTLKAKHDVDPDQFEPGIPEGEQARQHALSIGMLEWDFDAQIGVHRRFAFELFVPVRTTIIDASFGGGGGEPLPNFESIHHRDETLAGVGDVTLGGRTGLVLPTDVPRWTFALRTAVSLPTGDIKPDPFKLGAETRDMPTGDMANFMRQHANNFIWLASASQ